MDAIIVSNFTEAWDFDKTGNWTQYDRDGVVENRTHNAANEIATIGGVATNVASDKNGNMTKVPKQTGVGFYDCVYDAWNRLVQVKDGAAVVASYSYNGANQRVRKTVGSTVTTSFFNENWQEFESIAAGQVTSFVWGTRYIDDLILREKGQERLYSLADPNWNVVATVNAAGTVQERMRYDAFGKVTWLDAAFVAKPNSDYAWNRAFTGQVLDAETGLMLYRNRYFDTRFGRFVSRDPIEYLAGDVNLHRYVGNMPIRTVDPAGLHWYCLWIDDYIKAWKELSQPKNKQNKPPPLPECPPPPPPPPPPEEPPPVERECPEHCKSSKDGSTCLPCPITPPPFVGPPVIQPITNNETKDLGCQICNDTPVVCETCCVKIHPISGLLQNKCKLTCKYVNDY